MLVSLFNKVEDLKVCNFIKNRLQHWCFPVIFVKSSRTPFLKNICEGLHLVHQPEMYVCHYVYLSFNCCMLYHWKSVTGCMFRILPNVFWRSTIFAKMVLS